MARNNRFGGDSIIIRKMLIQQTGCFQDMYSRGWEMNLDDDTYDSLKRRIMGAGKNSPLTTTAFRGLSSGILAPVAEVDSIRDAIHIPDGWDRPRCRFMMEVEVETRLGSTDTYYIQGFSDHLGMTASGNIDPDMRWFINGFIRVQYMERNTPRGLERYGVVKSSAQVINGRLLYDDQAPVSLTRTVDLFSNIQERFYQGGSADDIEDMRTRLNSPADSHFANRIDNLPGQYLSSTLSTYRRSIDTNQFGTGFEDVMGRAQQELNAELINAQENPFLIALARIQAQPNTTVFTINDLLDIDPGAGQKGVIQGGRLEGRAAESLAHRDESVSDWRGADLESRWAVQISNAVSALMMKSYHRGLNVRISNMNMTAEIITEVRDATPVAEGMPLEIFDAMIDDIQDLMRDLSADSRHIFSVELFANLYDQTELFIKIDNEPEQRFFVPSFADSLMTPFYTRDQGLLTTLATDVERIIGELDGELSTSAFDVAGSF